MFVTDESGVLGAMLKILITGGIFPTPKLRGNVSIIVPTLLAGPWVGVSSILQILQRKMQVTVALAFSCGCSSESCFYMSASQASKLRSLCTHAHTQTNAHTLEKLLYLLFL